MPLPLCVSGGGGGSGAGEKRWPAHAPHRFRPRHAPHSALPAPLPRDTAADAVSLRAIGADSSLAAVRSRASACSAETEGGSKTFTSWCAPAAATAAAARSTRGAIHPLWPLPQNPALANFMCRTSWTILPRLHTNLCRKHQRRVAKSIKQARHFAVLPFFAEHRLLNAEPRAFAQALDTDGFYAFPGFVRRSELGLEPAEDGEGAFWSGSDRGATTVAGTDDRFLAELEELTLTGGAAAAEHDVSELYDQVREIEMALTELESNA